ncbi:hypothetical protein CAEBREN_31327 [Caenorhabditis brenneri]|uniref:Uncharacterized protein n=1 Tax=Caenorhabditis brenneri TaxID=135651 RepID=G0PD61_CAEBE|nr:hypothetical protein CAEBREN_31327 [Caenorhabditis brenneri]
MSEGKSTGQKRARSVTPKTEDQDSAPLEILQTTTRLLSCEEAVVSLFPMFFLFFSPARLAFTTVGPRPLLMSRCHSYPMRSSF